MNKPHKKQQMATRRQGREWALQMLVQADLNPGQPLDKTIPAFWRQQWTVQLEKRKDNGEEVPSEDTPQEVSIEDQVAPPKIRGFAEKIVRGVLEHHDELDKKIQSYVENWSMYRIGTVERNVLRLAFYEMSYCPDVPPPVVLNEAIDLAKYFSNIESGHFVNGILDRYNKDLHPAESAAGK